MAGTPPSETEKKAPGKRRITRFFMPDVDKGGVFMPTDRWIIDNVRDIIRSKPLHKKTLWKAAGYALATAGLVAATCLAYPFAGAYMAMSGTTAFPQMLFAYSFGSIFGTTSLLTALSMRDHWKVLRSKVLPDVRRDISRRYMQSKIDDVKNEWDRRLKDIQEERARKKKAEALVPVPEKKKKVVQDIVIIDVSAVEEPAPEKTTDRMELAKKFSKWAIKTAAEKVSEKIADRKKKKDGGKPGTP